MLANSVSVTHPGSPASTEFALTVLNGGESIRVATNSAGGEEETLRIRASQAGKAGATVLRRNIVFNHVWTADDGSEQFCSASYTISMSKSLNSEGNTVAHRQLARLISLLQPSILDLDDLTPSSNFAAVLRGEI
jgi:hypothetical protein